MQLQTDLGLSVGVMTTIELVWLNPFTGFQPANWQQKHGNEKYKRLNIFK